MTPSLLRGILLMLGSTVFFALMNALVKYLASLGYSSMENIFFRALLMVFTMWACFLCIPPLNKCYPSLNLKIPKITSRKRGGFAKILTRSFFGAIAMSLAFYNFATIPLGVATTFLQSMPIFMVIFTLFTKNKPNFFIIAATLIGFMGVVLIANPQTSNIPLINILAGIIGAMSAALSFMTIQALRQYYESGAVVLWYGVAMSFVGAFGMLLPIEKMGGFTLPDTLGWTLFILTGLSGTIGQWLMTKSYMYAPVGIVAPITYMRIVWSVFLGMCLGDSFPNGFTLTGMGLIIFSGLLIALPILVKEIKN